MASDCRAKIKQAQNFPYMQKIQNIEIILNSVEFALRMLYDNKDPRSNQQHENIHFQSMGGELYQHWQAEVPSCNIMRNSFLKGTVTMLGSLTKIIILNVVIASFSKSKINVTVTVHVFLK